MARTEAKRSLLRRHWILVLVSVAALVTLAFGLLAASRPPAARESGSAKNPVDLPGLNGDPPPWPPETSRLAQRLDLLGFPQLRLEPDTFHIHAHLDVFVAGEVVNIPAGIGIDEQAGYFAPLHTHADLGIIHVESPTETDYTLGQFFAVWGIRLDEDCLGRFCEGENGRLEVYVNGKRFEGNPFRLVLEPYQQIVVAYGTEEQLRRDYPSSYVFPEGT